MCKWIKPVWRDWKVDKIKKVIIIISVLLIICSNKKGLDSKDYAIFLKMKDIIMTNDIIFQEFDSIKNRNYYYSEEDKILIRSNFISILPYVENGDFKPVYKVFENDKYKLYALSFTPIVPVSSYLFIESKSNGELSHYATFRGYTGYSNINNLNIDETPFLYISAQEGARAYQYPYRHWTKIIDIEKKNEIFFITTANSMYWYHEDFKNREVKILDKLHNGYRIIEIIETDSNNTTNMFYYKWDSIKDMYVTEYQFNPVKFKMH